MVRKPDGRWQRFRGVTESAPDLEGSTLLNLLALPMHRLGVYLGFFREYASALPVGHSERTQVGAGEKEGGGG